MTIFAWVIARDVQINDIEISMEYWTGEGSPWKSPFRSDAFHFTTPGSAYECAQTHSRLKDSEEWRVIPADPKLRRRA